MATNAVLRLGVALSDRHAGPFELWHDQSMAEWLSAPKDREGSADP